MIDDGVLLVLEQRRHGGLVGAVGFVLEPVDLDGALRHALALLERLHRADDLIGRVHDDARELARARPDAVDVVEPDDRGRRVDRVHHVVERPGQRVDVFAVERRDEGAVAAAG